MTSEKFIAAGRAVCEAEAEGKEIISREHVRIAHSAALDALEEVEKEREGWMRKHDQQFDKLETAGERIKELEALNQVLRDDALALLEERGE